MSKSPTPISEMASFVSTSRNGKSSRASFVIMLLQMRSWDQSHGLKKRWPLRSKTFGRKLLGPSMIIRANRRTIHTSNMNETLTRIDEKNDQVGCSVKRIFLIRQLIRFSTIPRVSIKFINMRWWSEPMTSEWGYRQSKGFCTEFIYSLFHSTTVDSDAVKCTQ